MLWVGAPQQHRSVPPSTRHVPFAFQAGRGHGAGTALITAETNIDYAESPFPAPGLGPPDWPMQGWLKRLGANYSG